MKISQVQIGSTQPYDDGKQTLAMVSISFTCLTSAPLGQIEVIA